jgi:tetratricopeptide (TPR) repeat protein
MLSRTTTTLLLAAGALFAQQRFDMVIRNDFFAGFTGNKEALERGLKKCEAVLATDPKDPEALVWHGSGIFFKSGQAAQAKDYATAMDLYKRGLDEMTNAVALAPDSVGVLIPRGASLLAASQYMPDSADAKQLLQTGLGDYEKVYSLQQDHFDNLNGHARGELLFGLAEGYQRLGDQARAREYFQKLAAVDDPENGHLRQAKAYLESNKLEGPRSCVGCHVSK